MQRMMLLMLFLGLGLLTGCSQGNDLVTDEARELSADEITAYFARQGLELHSVEVRPGNAKRAGLILNNIQLQRIWCPIKLIRNSHCWFFISMMKV